VGLATTFTVYGTNSSFGIYEGFWGLAANLLTIILLNPFFAAKAKHQTNSVKEYLFIPAKSAQSNIKKGA
jgi:solute:Na+ symporter, SSS family